MTRAILKSKLFPIGLPALLIIALVAGLSLSAGRSAQKLAAIEAAQPKPCRESIFLMEPGDSGKCLHPTGVLEVTLSGGNAIAVCKCPHE